MSSFQVYLRRQGSGSTGCGSWGGLDKLLCNLKDTPRDIWLVPIDACVEVGDIVTINGTDVTISQNSYALLFAEPSVGAYTLCHKLGLLRIKSSTPVGSVTYTDTSEGTTIDLSESIIQTADLTDFKYIACDSEGNLCNVNGFDIVAQHVQQALCAIEICVDGCTASTVYPTPHIYRGDTSGGTVNQVNVDTISTRIDDKANVDIGRSSSIVQYMNIEGTVVTDVTGGINPVASTPSVDYQTVTWEQQHVDDLNEFFNSATFGGSSLASQGWSAQVDTLAVNDAGNLDGASNVAPLKPRVIITHPANLSWTLHADDPGFCLTENVRTSIYCNDGWYYDERDASTAYDVNSPVALVNLDEVSGDNYGRIYTGDTADTIVRNVLADSTNIGQATVGTVDITGGNKV